MPDELACPISTMSDLLEAENRFECATCGHEIDAKAAGMGVLIRAQFVKKA